MCCRVQRGPKGQKGLYEEMAWSFVYGGLRGPLRREGLIEDGAWSCLKIQRGVERVFGFLKDMESL